jgi:4-amino-4-deoxy-L-arabinose transferase-like glycosyltransferase
MPTITITHPLSENRGPDPARGGRRLLAALGVYFGLQMLARLLFADSLQLDEAEQMVVAQEWRWGYGSQPPLYTWLQKGLFALLGEGVFALALFKNATLWAAYFFVYLAAREILAETRLAALAAASMLFIPHVAWDSQRDQTHLALAMALGGATLFVFVRLLKDPKPKWYACLGGAAALGILSKYNYALLLAPLLLAALLTRRFRPAVLNPKMLVALAVGAVFLAPHLDWVWEHKALATSQAYKFKMAAENSGAEAYARGSMRLARSALVLAAGPLLVFAPFLRRAWKNRTRPGPEQPFPALLGRAFLCGLCLAFAVTLAFRVTYVRDRWLQPLLFVFPILLVAWARPHLTDRAVKALFALAAVLAATVLLLINGTVLGANALNRAHNLNLPQAALAAELRAAGFQNGTVIADGFMTGGNLKLQFPRSRVVVPGFGDEAPAPAGPKLIVWSARDGALPEEFLEYAARVAGTDRAALRPRSVEVACRNGPRRSERLGFVLLD